MLVALIHVFLLFSGALPADAVKMVKEVETDLKENILPFWEKNTPDPNGGFYGTILNDGTPLPDAEKGGVLNARILWTFSRAYHLFGKDSYRTMADRAQHYFLQHFIDREYGGTYWSVNADGTPKDMEKQTYGIAFAIYGLGEHFRATGNQKSLEAAVDLYRALEKHAFDPENGGYTESFTRTWEKPERFGYDGSGVAEKTMNTHLHVLEAYTLLYQVWPDKELEKQLKGIISIFFDKIVDQQRGHERLFLTKDWKNLEHIDSYGHDVELSWLILEAAHVLQDQALIKQTETLSLKLVDTQMKEGLTPEGYLLYERENGQIKGGIDWWPQAESVVAFYNAWQISGDEKYLDAAGKTWNWIKTNLVDYEYGEWYTGLQTDGLPNKSRPKADLWKCPYHNSRMGFELYTRASEMEK